MNENNELALTSAQLSAPMSVPEVIKHVAMIREITEKVMQEGVHYGNIAAQLKPSLFQPGAQTLCVAFKLSHDFKWQILDKPNGHREVIVECILSTFGGNRVGSGLGSCSTLEEKYRYRHNDSDAEPTEHVVPQSFWRINDKEKKQQLLRQIMDDQKGHFVTVKVGPDGKRLPKGAQGGEWRIARIPEGAKQKVENENLADTYNTVLKMAVKRSLVAAVLNTTGASDTFTQDLEDLRDHLADIDVPNTAQAAQNQGQESPQASDRKPTAPEKPAKQDTAKNATTGTGAGTSSGTPAAPHNPAPVNADPGNWRNVIVHVEKSTLKGYQLGQLQLEHLQAIKTRWIENPKGFPAKPSKEDLKLKAAVLLGIDELTKGGKPPVDGNIEQKKPGEPNPAPEYPAEFITALREKCQDAMITEATFFDELRKHTPAGHTPPPEDLHTFDDDRIDESFLKAWHNNFDKMVKEWGHTNPEPPKPEERKTGRPRRKKP